MAEEIADDAAFARLGRPVDDPDPDRVIGDPAHFAQNPRKIIHIDIDPSSISKRVKVDVPIVVRLDGTNGDEGRTLLADAGLESLHIEATMNGAAEKIVELAG